MRWRLITAGALAVVIALFVATVRVRVVEGPRTPPPPPRAFEASAPLPGAAHASEPLAVPVLGVDAVHVADSWGDPRGGGTRPHFGTDIAASAGTPVVAAAPGSVEKLFESEAGGITLYIRSPGRHWSYYYAHLAGYAPGLSEGARVRTGQTIGYVGDSGNAGAGNYHLHFGLSRMAPGDAWWQGIPVDPYPLLAGKRGPG